MADVKNSINQAFAAMKLTRQGSSTASSLAVDETFGAQLGSSHSAEDDEVIGKSKVAASAKSGDSGSQAARSTASDGAIIQRYTPPFIRNGQRSLDDPFQSPRPEGSSSNIGSAKKESRALAKSNWRSSSGSSCASVSSVNSVQLHSKATITGSPTGHKRVAHLSAGKDGFEFSTFIEVPMKDTHAADASSCSVFVANLLKAATDDTLRAAVIGAFGEYGPVEVKVRRDGRDMPYAFVQYTHKEDAARALELGRGREILGRRCRCERAKANRTYLVESNCSEALVPEIVRDVMSEYGAVDACYPTTPDLCRNHRLNPGVIVRFRTYDAGQAANLAMRHHDELQMRSAPSLQTPPGNAETYLTPPPTHMPTVEEIDRLSIFVGNIHPTTTDLEIIGLFSEFGKIEQVQRHECESRYEPGTQYFFAFVEFKYASCVQPAIDKMHFYNFGGKILKVQRKISGIYHNNESHPTITTPTTVPAEYGRPLPRMTAQEFFAQSQPYVDATQQYGQQPPQYVTSAPVTYITPPHVTTAFMGQSYYNGYTFFPEIQQWLATPPPVYYNNYAGGAFIPQPPPVYYNPAPATGYVNPGLVQYYAPSANCLVTTNERTTTPARARQTSGDEADLGEKVTEGPSP